MNWSISFKVCSIKNQFTLFSIFSKNSILFYQYVADLKISWINVGYRKNRSIHEIRLQKQMTQTFMLIGRLREGCEKGQCVLNPTPFLAELFLQRKATQNLHSSKRSHLDRAEMVRPAPDVLSPLHAIMASGTVERCQLTYSSWKRSFVALHHDWNRKTRHLLLAAVCFIVLCQFVLGMVVVHISAVD